MQAIITKYYGPSARRNARIVAKAWAGSHTVTYDHSLGRDGNHIAAARALAAELHWTGAWVMGGMPDGSGDGSVFVCITKVEPAFVLLTDGEA